MASNLKVIIENSQAKFKIPSGTRMLVRRSCHAVLQREHYDAQAEIHVVFADNDLLNEYADRRVSSFEATELVTLPSDDEGLNLGTIIISVERILELVKVYNQPYEMGIVYSAVHGVLNLLGYYYTDVRAREEQMINEAAILTALGFPPLAGAADFAI